MRAGRDNYCENAGHPYHVSLADGSSRCYCGEKIYPYRQTQVWQCVKCGLIKTTVNFAKNNKDVKPITECLRCGGMWVKWGRDDSGDRKYIGTGYYYGLGNEKVCPRCGK